MDFGGAYDRYLARCVEEYYREEPDEEAIEARRDYEEAEAEARYEELQERRRGWI